MWSMTGLLSAVEPKASSGKTRAVLVTCFYDKSGGESILKWQVTGKSERSFEF
jgi:hypothetical protein